MVGNDSLIEHDRFFAPRQGDARAMWRETWENLFWWNGSRDPRANTTAQRPIARSAKRASIAEKKESEQKRLIQKMQRKRRGPLAQA